jgi:hypothetical protein
VPDGNGVLQGLVAKTRRDQHGCQNRHLETIAPLVEPRAPLFQVKEAVDHAQSTKHHGQPE